MVKGKRRRRTSAVEAMGHESQGFAVNHSVTLGTSFVNSVYGVLSYVRLRCCGVGVGNNS